MAAPINPNPKAHTVLQLRLEQEYREKLVKYAQEQGIPIIEAVRRAIDLLVEGQR